MLAPLFALVPAAIVAEWRPMPPISLPVREIGTFGADLRNGTGRITIAGPPAARFWWNGREARPIDEEPDGVDMGTGLLVRADGDRLETIRHRDGRTIGNIPLPLGRFLRMGYAIWPSFVTGEGSVPLDLRTGAPIPEGQALIARFGADGRLDLLDARRFRERNGSRNGYYRVRRTNSDGTVQETNLGVPEIWFQEFSGTEDGPMVFRFEGSNVGTVGNELLNADLRRLPVQPDAVHDVSSQGFLVSLVDDVVPPMEKVPKSTDLTLLDARTGRVRWTRPMTSPPPFWCGDFPALWREEGVTVLSPSTGRALLTKPWPGGALGHLGGDLFGAADPKTARLRVFRLELRRTVGRPSVRQ